MANQYINKVIYGGNTLIDLTADTLDAEHLLAPYTGHDKSGAPITGACTFDADTSDATAKVGEILAGKTAYVNGVKLTGTMTNNGGANVTVSSKNGATIPQGYHDGSGKAVLDDASLAALKAENVRQGITILGVEGTMSGSEDVKAQAKTATPATTQQVIAPDSGFNYLTQVTVAAIPYVETDNAAGGKTVTIAAA